MTIGFVYCLRNHCMPGLFKIGMTERSPYQRMRDLQTTGVPGEFEMVIHVEVEDPARIERELHAFLAEYRMSGREFFRCTEFEVAEALFRVIHDGVLVYSVHDSDLAPSIGKQGYESLEVPSHFRFWP